MFGILYMNSFQLLTGLDNSTSHYVIIIVIPLNIIR